MTWQTGSDGLCRRDGDERMLTAGSRAFDYIVQAKVWKTIFRVP